MHFFSSLMFADLRGFFFHAQYASSHLSSMLLVLGYERTRRAQTRHLSAGVQKIAIFLATTVYTEFGARLTPCVLRSSRGMKVCAGPKYVISLYALKFVHFSSLLCAFVHECHISVTSSVLHLYRVIPHICVFSCTDAHFHTCRFRALACTYMHFCALWFTFVQASTLTCL